MLKSIGKRKWTKLTHTANLKDFKCVICKKTIKVEYGNNPAPVVNKGKYCAICNANVGIPNRTNLMLAYHKYFRLYDRCLKPLRVTILSC